VDGVNDCQLLFTPAIDRDGHGPFLGQIGAVEPDALHVVIADQSGVHLPEGDPRIPQKIRLLRLTPYCPESKQIERFDGLLKAAVATASTPLCQNSNATLKPPRASGHGPSVSAPHPRLDDPTGNTSG
jgi:hypothetical protein